jgi:hypothetical protein
MSRMYFTRKSGSRVATQSRCEGRDQGEHALLIGDGRPDSLCFPDDPALGKSAGREFDVKHAGACECIKPGCDLASQRYELHGTDILVCECVAHKWQFFRLG